MIGIKQTTIDSRLGKHIVRYRTAAYHSRVDAEVDGLRLFLIIGSKSINDKLQVGVACQAVASDVDIHTKQLNVVEAYAIVSNQLIERDAHAQFFGVEERVTALVGNSDIKQLYAVERRKLDRIPEFDEFVDVNRKEEE